MKELLRKIKNRVVKFIKENPIFFISIIISVMFIICPLLLRLSAFETMISLFLRPLKEQGFKSSYIETLGAILGTFLAISGALWTQRRFEQEAESRIEEERKRERLLIIYYDFKFVFDDIQNNMNFYLYKKEGAIYSVLVTKDVDIFRKQWKKFKIHIYNDWIANVASVSKYFTQDEIKLIYEIYGDFDELNQIFEESIEEISDSELKIAYSKIFKYIIPIKGLKSGRIEKVQIKEYVNNLLMKMRNIGGFQ